jgi:GNAT superfamily N-acetyltransferase
MESTREFVTNNIAARNPQLVTLDKGNVIGWCDVRREHRPAHAHCGTLGMGLLPDYRGKGLGRRLMQATLDVAQGGGFVRVELMTMPTICAPSRCMKSLALCMRG